MRRLFVRKIFACVFKEAFYGACQNTCLSPQLGELSLLIDNYLIEFVELLLLIRKLFFQCDEALIGILFTHEVQGKRHPKYTQYLRKTRTFHRFDENLAGGG
jgi:hypothetical protein